MRKANRVAKIPQLSKAASSNTTLVPAGKGSALLM